MNERKLIFDEDCSALLLRAPLGRVEETGRAWFEHLFASGVDVLIVDCATPEIVVVRKCPHGERFGERIRHFERVDFWHMEAAMKELFDQETDLLQIASETARSHGKMIFAEMRMSDAHHYDTVENPLYSSFVLEHPELCIQLEDGKPDIVLDYSHAEVRARRLAVLRDIAENYDIDGINLNWMRWCRHFAKDRQREKAPILTAFLREVRAMLDEVAAARGRERFMLTHYVAAELDESLDIGCDVTTWAAEGLADFIIPMDFLFTDFNIKTEEFVAATEGMDCGVYPGVHSSLIFLKEGGHLPEYTTTEDKYRAAARNLYSWGAHGISCYNFCCWGFDPRFADRMLAAFEILSSPQTLCEETRHYHFVPTWKDHSGGIGPTGKHRAQILQFRRDRMGERLAFRFRMADGRQGERLKGKMIARINGGMSLDAFELDINGKSAPADGVESEDKACIEAHGYAAYPPGIKLCVRLEDCPPFAGDNELGIRWTKATPRLKSSPCMEVLEIFVEP